MFPKQQQSNLCGIKADLKLKNFRLATVGQGQNVVVLILLTSYHTYKMVFVSCFPRGFPSKLIEVDIGLSLDVYKEVWEPVIGEYSQCFLDNTNLHDPPPILMALN